MRQSLDLTQEALAELVSCSTFTVRKIEAGQRRPSREVAALLADRLNVHEAERASFLALARARPVNRAAQGRANGAARIGDTAAPTNLPTPLSALIGRQDVVADIVGIVTSGTRLITLTGPPGIGKTRLAIQSGWAMQTAFPDGVWFIALDSIEHADVVADEVARTVKADAAPSGSNAESLARALHGKRVLLILDNFEHVLPAASFVADLLVRCPELAAIATSREPLHLRGERNFAVPSLCVPDLHALPPITELAINPAVALFAEAAKSVAPEFALHEHNAVGVATICVALEGLPLAIELVAGHMQTQSAQTLAEKLDERMGQSSLSMLDSGPVDLPPRQRILRGAIAESYHSLTQAERSTFSQLGIFPGDFALNAAVHVQGDRRDDVTNIADGLGAMIDKSLLKRSSDDTSEPRYVMLRAIREFARERLAREGADAIARRHAEYFVAQASQLAKSTMMDDATVRAIERDHHNFAMALDATINNGDAKRAATLCTSLWRFWRHRGRFSEGRHYLERVTAIGGGLPPGVRAELFLASATLARSQSAHRQAQGFIDESIAISRSLSDRHALAHALKEAGTIADYCGEFERAKALLAESIGEYSRLGDDWGAAAALGNLAVVEQEQGHLDVARRYHAESLALQRKIGDVFGIAAALNNLGLLAKQQGDWGAATAAWTQSLALMREVGDEQNVVTVLNNLGMAELQQGDVAAAKAHFAENLRLSRTLSDRLNEASALLHLAEAAFVEGDYGRAAVLLSRALPTFEQLRDQAKVAACIRSFAELALRYRRPMRAAVLIEAARRILQSGDVAIFPIDAQHYECIASEARAGLEDSAFASACLRGASMDTQSAIAYALDDSISTAAVD
ncbi:MAG: tetratricopeptide repeat protein [Candidatus Eremiobacteraeota bacterium]|nr:tetratricopeptide repeat protein [Candidatus Eremiobacteraeota bacterium]